MHTVGSLGRYLKYYLVESGSPPRIYLTDTQVRSRAQAGGIRRSRNLTPRFAAGKPPVASRFLNPADIAANRRGHAGKRDWGCGSSRCGQVDRPTETDSSARITAVDQIYRNRFARSPRTGHKATAGVGPLAQTRSRPWSIHSVVRSPGRRNLRPLIAAETIDRWGSLAARAEPAAVGPGRLG